MNIHNQKAAAKAFADFWDGKGYEKGESQPQPAKHINGYLLDARALYPDSSLADLYDELTMPPELRSAHLSNDLAVMEAYGFVKGTEAYSSESACVAELMRRYQTIIKHEKS